MKISIRRKNGMSLLSEHLEEGAICPFCGSQDIDGGPIDVIGNETMQDCSCHACGKRWRDEYVLFACRELEE